MYSAFLAAHDDITPLVVTTLYLPGAQRSSKLTPLDGTRTDCVSLAPLTTTSASLQSQQRRNHVVSELGVEVEQIRGRYRVVDKSRRQIYDQEIVAFVLDVRPNRNSSVTRSAQPSLRVGCPISERFQTYTLVAFAACELDSHHNRIMLHEAKRSSTLYSTFVLSVPV